MGKLPMPFGNPRTRPNHSGIDFPQAAGTKILASGPGRVVRNSHNKAGGYWTVVNYDGHGEYGYAHQPSNSPRPAVGTRTVEGTILGVVGSTGNSTGPHLHLEKISNPIDSAVWGDFDKNRVVGAKPTPTPTNTSGAKNPFGIAFCAGLQKIANLYGAGTKIDQIWGAKSARGFSEFLRRNYGYKGNDVLGPVMWAAIARWLRARWGYVGNDVPGPVMRAALQRAETANYHAL